MLTHVSLIGGIRPQSCFRYTIKIGRGGGGGAGEFTDFNFYDFVCAAFFFPNLNFHIDSCNRLFYINLF